VTTDRARAPAGSSDIPISSNTTNKERSMKRIIRLVACAATALGVTAWAGPVTAGAVGVPGGPQARTGADHVVFVQTDNPEGNQVVAYDRADDGTLTLANSYSTGGSGGVLNGSVVDHLASQGSLTYDSDNALLYAVNAGSNTVSVFSVAGDELELRQVVDSGGTFPVSVAVSHSIVYVLNARDGGSVSGYRAAGGTLHPIQGSVRPLGLVTPTDESEFTHTPGQVTFSPDGSQVIVTTKAPSNALDVFAVTPSGRLSAAPVVNSEPDQVPFAAAFDASGHLAVTNAGPNSLATFSLAADGTATLLDEVATGQGATCWITPAQGYLFTSNAASASLSRFAAAPDGQLTLLGATPTNPGTVDASAAANGQFLYVQTGAAGTVDQFRINADGTLTGLGSVTVAGAAGGEGIVAF
jgi:6-phosphogluconolactonase (cycloisomerase 2 family)